MNLQSGFTPLQVHSFYSFLWGVSAPERLCAAARDRGYGTLALTDINGLYGLVPFLKAARRHRLRAVVGAHLKAEGREAVVLVMTPKGYSMLCRLISYGRLEGNPFRCPDLRRSAGHLAFISRDPVLLKELEGLDRWVAVFPGPEGRQALKAASILRLPPVAVAPVDFADEDDFELHRLVRAIAMRRTLSTLDPSHVTSPDAWLQPAKKVLRRFPHCPEAVGNAAMLAERAFTAWGDFPTLFPSYDQGDGFSALVRRCREGIRWRYGRAFPELERRLQKELDLIRRKGYVDYVLTVSDIVRRRPIHCGRGSGAASLVNYLLGVTHVDPLRHGLVFERFLNPQREDYPDIDVDFPWDERDELLDEVMNDYGRDRAAMVAVHVGFRGRGAVREVAKVMGVPPEEIREVSRRLGGWVGPKEVAKRVASHPAFRGMELGPPWPDIFRLAARLEDLPRHPALHCGGIVLVPGRVDERVPVERSAKGVRVIQWDKDQAEEAGLVKIDLLGNRSLAVIRDALRAVEENTGKRISYAELNPLDDPATRKLFAHGKTMGIFYVESPAMRQLQKKTGKGDFEHLVIHSSIIRPAANRYIEAYIRRLHGEPYKPIHPDLEELLAETYGIFVYQEQVVQAAMILAGFDWAEADALRKVLSKKSTEDLAAFRDRFRRGCEARGVAPHVVDAVWDMFTSFAGYSFCKPHSASYAMVSFKAGWLKAHYPAEFMAAVLSNGGGYYSTWAYVSEARRMGLRVLGPDVNRSRWHYHGKGRVVRVGLQQIRGVRREVLERILAERDRRGHYRSLRDFAARVPMGRKDGWMLVKSGALDSLAGGLNRAQLLWWAASRANAGKNGKASTLAMFRSPGAAPPLPEETPDVVWRHQWESLGFVVSVHPLALYDRAFRSARRRWVRARDLPRHVGRCVWLRGWPVTAKEVATQEGEPMEFVSFEDETDIYETVFFPGAFRRWSRYLVEERPFWVFGKVEAPYGAITVTVERLEPAPS